MFPKPVTLAHIAEELRAMLPNGDVVVKDVHHDSRNVTHGSVFVAIPGDKRDGHEFVSEAVERGASALILERAISSPIPMLLVDDSRAALAIAAAVVHGFPGKAIDLAGVTGTDGKTTVTYMLHRIASMAGCQSGVIGTLGARVGADELGLKRTTPEASDIQRLLHRMVDRGVEICSLEVSSHALALHRVDALRFNVAGFTNLSQDHLDFHGDMESYFAVKQDLFSPARSRRAVISIDDPWGKRLADTVEIPLLRVGRSSRADVRAADIVGDSTGTSFVLSTPQGEAAIRLPLAGLFNVDNSLVAAGMGLEIGIGFDQVCAGLESLRAVPGRFEIVDGAWPFRVVVDYAHTPRAVAAAIAEARSMGKAKVIAVIGAGGDRDVGKRPLIGAAASAADVVVVTTDNPRSEDPEDIVDLVASGVAGSCLVVEVDRNTAITKALEMASDEDFVLVLGKGHEREQEFADEKVVPFNDREAVQQGWRMLTGVAE